MSSGLFTIHTELVADPGVFEQAYDAGLTMRATRSLSCFPIVDAALYQRGANSLHNDELQGIFDSIREVVPIAIDLYDADPKRPAVAGVCLPSGLGDRGFMAEVATHTGQVFEEDEFILENGLVPTLLSNPRQLDDFTTAIKADMVISTWRKVEDTETGFTPVHPHLKSILQYMPYKTLAEQVSVKSVQDLIKRVEKANRPTRGLSV